MNRALAAAALALVGVRFRLHGRDPATGLDCVGLVAAAMTAAGHVPRPPQGYRLRMMSCAPLLGCAAASGLEPVPEDGDIWLVHVHPSQPHLLIAAPRGAVHAHAGLGRVVFLPGAPPWPIVRRWRIASPDGPVVEG